MSFLYKLIFAGLAATAIWFAGHQSAMKDIEKKVLEAQQKTTQECHAKFDEVLEQEKALNEEARLRNERLDQTVTKLNERLKKKPAIQIIETPNQEPVYESCDLDSVRLDLGTVRLLNELRAGK
jgi:hypothetical protein